MEQIYNSDLFIKENPGVLDKLKSIFTKAPSKQLLYNIQFNALTIIVGLLFGSIIDYFFPEYNSEKENHIILIEIIMQILIISVFIYYIPKIVHLVPYFGDKDFNYTSSNVNIMLSIAFIASQVNILKKLQHLSKSLKHKYNKVNNKLFNNENVQREDAKKIIKQFMKENPGVLSVNKNIDAANINTEINGPVGQKSNVDTLIQTYKEKYDENEKILPDNIGQYPREKGIIEQQVMPSLTGNNYMSNMSNEDITGISNSLDNWGAAL